MKKEHIADAVLVETGGKLSKKEATAAVNTVLETIAKGIKQEGLVKIAGFGTFAEAYHLANAKDIENLPRLFCYLMGYLNEAGLCLPKKV